jgi:hypothetical protein
MSLVDSLANRSQLRRVTRTALKSSTAARVGEERVRKRIRPCSRSGAFLGSSSELILLWRC